MKPAYRTGRPATRQRAVFPGRQAVVAHEHAAEMTLVPEAAREGDLGERLRGTQQQRRRTLEAAETGERPGCAAHVTPEGARQMDRVDPDCGSNLGNAELFAVAIVQ